MTHQELEIKIRELEKRIEALEQASYEDKHCEEPKTSNLLKDCYEAKLLVRSMS